MTQNEKPILLDILYGPKVAVLKCIRFNEWFRDVGSILEEEGLSVRSNCNPEIGSGIYIRDTEKVTLYLPGSDERSDEMIIYHNFQHEGTVDKLLSLKDITKFDKHEPFKPSEFDCMVVSEFNVCNSSGDRLLEGLAVDSISHNGALILTGINTSIDLPVINFNTGLISRDEGVGWRINRDVTDQKITPRVIYNVADDYYTSSANQIMALQEDLFDVKVKDPNAFICKKHELKREII